MDFRISFELYETFRQLTFRSPRILALNMIESCCDLDQSLEEGPVITPIFLPGLFPYLMSIEEFFLVKKPDPLLEALVNHLFDYTQEYRKNQRSQ